MDTKKWLYKINKEPKWVVTWYLTTGVLCALTCLVLSRTGYLPWDDITALLLGFFVPIVIYSFKEIMRWYEYPRRYSMYAVSERYLELSLEYMEKERWQDALSNLNLIQRNMPDHQRAQYYSAICKEKLGNYQGANENIARYLKMKPDDDEALELQKRVGAASGI
ncbi:MAG: tetratricopeptide repeat protein [Candidatus Thorarchaeota archaeon]